MFKTKKQGGSPKPAKTALEYSLYLLAKQDYSAAIMAQKLQQKGYKAGERADALKYLKEKGYIDDGRTIALLFNALLRAEIYSLNEIRAKLRQKGYAPELIEDTLLSLDDEARDEYERRAAAKTARAKFRRLLPPGGAEKIDDAAEADGAENADGETENSSALSRDWRPIAAHLYRHGFPSETAVDTAKELLGLD